MADVYVDLDKSSSTEDGTSWANAFRLLSEISVSSGDDVWIKGNTNAHSGGTLVVTFGSDAQNPVNVHGVKSTTTNEPPVQSDLIPGWRTGEARTVANRAYKDADVPVLAISDSSQWQIKGHAYFYGLHIRGGGTVYVPHSGNLVAEECRFDTTGSSDFQVPRVNANSHIRTINCAFETNNAFSRIALSERGEHVGLEYEASTVSTLGLFETVGHANTVVIGADLTGLGANPLFSLSSINAAEIKFLNCALHASTALTTGSAGENRFRLEFIQTDSTSGKSSGTIVTTDIVTDAGIITEETTAVRTGGANDGTTTFSHAFTPNANGTRDNYLGLVGPWMAFKVTGDGTSQIVSVHIANSGASDKTNDQVALEVMIPSEGGTAQYDNITTQMDLLGTPAAVTDDTDSTWGTGANNHQTLSASIAPDYIGRAYCRVIYYENFSSSPETLYVDPLPVVS